MLKKKLPYMSMILICLAIFITADLRAEEGAQEKPAPENFPKSFAIGLNAFSEHGFGGMIRYRTDHIALDGSVGAFLMRVSYQYVNYYNGTTTKKDEYRFPIHADASMVLYFIGDINSFQSGLRLGGVYDQARGMGAMFGWAGEVKQGSLALGFGIGLQYYPDAENKVKKYLDVDKSVKMEGINNVNLYLGLSFICYLM